MPARKKIAAIVTTWFPGSHANLIVSNFATGFPSEDGIIEPAVDLVSIYMDQVHVRDVGLQLAREHKIAVYPSIRGALTLTAASYGDWPTAADWNDGELAVDGVLIIGEHGDYPRNERFRRLYPRRRFFEEVCGVFASSNRAVPIFSDKHLAYNWVDAQWMYQRAKELGVSFMAGSALPMALRKPELEHELDSPIKEALSIGFIHSYVTGLDSYGFHALEVLQCMVERRRGQETGIAAVQCLEGDEVWNAGVNGLWSKELAAAAEARIETRMPGRMEENCKNPALFLLEYQDGLRAASLILPGHVQGFGYAARVSGNIVSTGFGDHRDYNQTFGYLGLNIQEMFLTGKPQYPIERTFLVTGILEALMESRYNGQRRMETPHLNISYRPPEEAPIRPLGEASP